MKQRNHDDGLDWIIDMYLVYHAIRKNEVRDAYVLIRAADGSPSLHDAMSRDDYELVRPVIKHHYVDGEGGESAVRRDVNKLRKLCERLGLRCNVRVERHVVPAYILSFARKFHKLYGWIPV